MSEKKASKEGNKGEKRKQKDSEKANTSDSSPQGNRLSSHVYLGALNGWMDRQVVLYVQKFKELCF